MVAAPQVLALVDFVHSAGPAFRGGIGLRQFALSELPGYFFDKITLFGARLPASPGIHTFNLIPLFFFGLGIASAPARRDRRVWQFGALACGAFFVCKVFPLWPLLQRPVGLLFGGTFPGSYYIGGLLLANLCFYCALVVLYKLLIAHFDAAIARRALFYMAFAPYALFFFAGYSESLFVLLCIASFLVLQGGQARNWWFAGLLGFLAALTRSSGVFLVVPYLVLYVQRFWIPSERAKSTWRAKLNALIPIVLIPMGVIAYLLYLYFTKGDAFIFSLAEKNYWNRHFSFPWTTGYLVIKAFFVAPSWIYLFEHLVSFVFTLLPLLVLGFGWKRIPLHYRLFATTLATFSLSFPLEGISPLLSQPRYLLILFPIFVILGIWGKRRRFHQWYFALSLTCFICFTASFICNLWVA